MMKKQILDVLREIYASGTRVELVKMDDPYSRLKSGDKGTVSTVDDIGTIFVNWDNGSGLGIVFGEDACRKIIEGENKTMDKTIKEQILAVRDTGLTNMFDIPRVKEIAEMMDFEELVVFLAQNKSRYCNFILTGEE